MSGDILENKVRHREHAFLERKTKRANSAMDRERSVFATVILCYFEAALQ